MRYSRLTLFGGVLSIAASFCLTPWAHAVVVFHEDFSLRPDFTDMIGKSPNVVDGPGTNPFLLSPGYPPTLPGPPFNTLTYTDAYGKPTEDSTVPPPSSYPNYGLKFKSPYSNTPAQTMVWPVNYVSDTDPTLNGRYTFGTDKVKLTIVARQIEFWNGFALGFADPDYNLSNMVRLVYAPGGGVINQHRVQIYLNHNQMVPGEDEEDPDTFQGQEFQRAYNSPAGLYTHEFATLSLEYDPNKVIGGALYEAGVSPYKFTYDPTNNGIDDGFEIALGGGNWHNDIGNGIPNGPTPIDLHPMTNSGGAYPSGFSGIGFGFWGSNPARDFSVLIKEIKLETFAQAVPEDDGDFNGDGVVDALDYIVWRAGNGPEADYTEWAENYGNDYNGSGSGTNAAVPEPASIAMLLLGLVAAGSVRRSVRR